MCSRLGQAEHGIKHIDAMKKTADELTSRSKQKAIGFKPRSMMILPRIW